MGLGKRFVVVLCVAIFAVGMIACEKEGALEKAGKGADSAFDSVKKKAEDLSK